jgi:Kef-type K+ transport system membrane component KefB
VPLFVLALLLVRGLPVLLYRRRTGTRRAAAAGLLQATTLTFVIVATQIGLATGKITPTVAASLVAAGLLTAALFPAGAQQVLSRATPASPGRSAKDSSSARAGRSTVTPGEEGMLLAILSAWEQAIRHHETAGPA